MTILIADDEEYVLKDVSKLIQTMEEAPDFTIHTALNGTLGLEQALLAPPDLLITDIEMPRADGFSLAESVLQLSPDCKVVFLSNHSEKEYLRNAIRLHVLDYLDKPINASALTSLIRRVYTEYKDASSKRSTMEKQVWETIQNAKLILTQLWSQTLRTKNANPESLRSQCTLYDMDYLFQVSYRCLMLRVDLHAKRLASLPGIPNVQMLPCDYTQNGTVILMLYAFDPLFLHDQAIRNFWEKLQLQSGYTGLGVGPVAKDYRSVYETWQIAQAAFNQLFFSSSPQIIFQQENHEVTPGILKEESLKKMINALQTPQASLENLDQLFASLSIKRSTPVNDIRNYFCKAADLILQYSSENLLDFHKKHSNFNLYEEIWSSASLRDLSDIVRGWINELLDLGVGEDRIMRITIAYIQKNYSSPSLSMDSLSQFTGYSKSYLSSVFKKMSGISIITYINEVRINNVCRLLRTTDFNLEQIASQTGFANQRYLCRVFKTHTKQTPNDYRRQQKEGMGDAGV